MTRIHAGDKPRTGGSLGAGPLASTELATEAASGDGGSAAMPVATARAWTTCVDTSVSQRVACNEACIHGVWP